MPAHLGEALPEHLGPPENFVNGATTKQLAPKPTYFSVLYTHQLFGHMAPWASNASKLPPTNSTRGFNTVSPAERNATRQYGGPPGAEGLPQWANLGPGAYAGHPGSRLHERAHPREYAHPASPSAHCQPTPPLPEIIEIRARTTAVPSSTHPLKRLPAHTVRRQQIDARLYQPEKSFSIFNQSQSRISTSK